MDTYERSSSKEGAQEHEVQDVDLVSENELQIEDESQNQKKGFKAKFHNFTHKLAGR